MKRVLLALVVFASLAAQETALPKDHYCLQGEPQNDRGHKCACKLICTTDDDGSVTGDQESTECKMYCRRDRYACHPEEPCEKPKGI